MKPVVLLLLAASWCVDGYSQIDFKNGYYIDSLGTKIDGLIKDVDWENNPTAAFARSRTPIPTTGHQNVKIALIQPSF